MTINSSRPLDPATLLARSLVPVALFVCACIGTVLLSTGPLTVAKCVTSAPFFLGLAATVAMARRCGDPLWERRVLSFLWVALFVLSVFNILFGWIPLLVYGDGNILLLMLWKEELPSKWLAGYEVLHVLYNVWQASPIHRWLPEQIAGVDVFVMLASTTAVSGGCLLLLRAWGDRLAVRLAAVAPFLLVLGPGYREYYPFIICLYLATLCFALARPLHERPAWLMGAMAGLLPAVYIGFIPWTVILFAASVAAQPRRAWMTLLSAAVSFPLAILIFWRRSFRSFFEDYLGNLHLGTRIPFQRYELQIDPGRSVFFRPGYVLHPEHLADLRYVAFYVGLLFTLIFAVIGVLVLAPVLRGRLRVWIRDPRFWICSALLAQQTHYFFFMVPHFGPRHDLDVYFTVPILAMLFAGFVWQEFLRDRGERARRIVSMAAFPLTLGHGAALATILLFSGLPNVYRGMEHIVQMTPEGGEISIDELLQSFDGASIVNTELRELYVYASFRSTIAAEINYAGDAPREFTITQHFTDSNSWVRAEVLVNEEHVGTWGGTPEAAGWGSAQFQATLHPGRNRYAIDLVPLEPKRGDASVHLGELVFNPK